MDDTDIVTPDYFTASKIWEDWVTVLPDAPKPEAKPAKRAEPDYSSAFDEARKISRGE